MRRSSIPTIVAALVLFLGLIFVLLGVMVASGVIVVVGSVIMAVAAFAWFLWYLRTKGRGHASVPVAGGGE